MLGTDFILDALAKEEIDHLFMVPGGLIDPFLPALGRQNILKPIVAAQEGGATYMADGYARASGKFGAAVSLNLSKLVIDKFGARFLFHRTMTNHSRCHDPARGCSTS